MKINKELMLEGFCLLRQAERSVDHVIFDDWHKLVCYYSGSREARIRKYLDRLTEVTHNNSFDLNRSVFESRLKPMSRLLIAFLTLCRNTRYCCHFMEDELGFIAFTLNTMLSFLSGDRPSKTDIIRLRMDTSLCQDLILIRCGTLPQIEKANMVENFDMPEYKQHYAVEEIIQI